MSETNVINLDDLLPITIQVKYNGKQYVLKEATEGAVCTWRNHQVKSARFSSTGEVIGIGNVSDSEPLLVSLCLFEVLTDGSHKAVSESVLRTWPARVVKPLFEKIKEISELGEKPTKAKASLGDDSSSQKGEGDNEESHEKNGQ